MKTADASPFDLIPRAERSQGAAALCLHGLTGTPYDLRNVAEALVLRGIRARAPWMAGHEQGHEALEKTSHQEWVDLAGKELESLRAEHDRVFLVGVSMGGLVSLRLAQTEKVDALVVVGVPLVLSRITRRLLPVARRFTRFRPKRGSDIREPSARDRHPGLAAMPLASVAELMVLQQEVIEDLPRVRAPILVSHGRLDRTANPRDAMRLHAEVGSREKELFYLDRSGHVATVDYDGSVLARAAADFLGRR